MGRRSASRKWLLLLLTAAALALVACADQSDSSGVSQPEWRSWKTRRRSESRDGGGEHRRPRHRAHKEPTTVREEEPQEDESGVEKCEVARLKCAYRVGCGMALQNYMVGCADVMSGASQRCSDHCRNALIALTSTEEGQALMKCKCGDSFCRDTKRRIDICRTAVLRATHNSTTVSCSVAQWICMADPLCSTALDYYHQYCRSMFTGKKCTHRCNNSISILRRQEKAAKLSTCVCDGSEDYDCQSIRDNMDRLCFHKTPSTTPKSGGGPGAGVDEYGISPARGGTGEGGSGHHAPPHPHHPRPRPHHPTTPDIESNEVEVRHRHPSTGHRASGGSSRILPPCDCASGFRVLVLFSAAVPLLSARRWVW